MNQNGQAYSVFKLLIAAIIAMAILGILVPIIMQVMGIITKEPVGETKTLLSNLVNSPGTLQETEGVTFKPDATLSADALTDRVPLSSRQLCFSRGAFDGDADFRIIDMSSAPYSDKLIYAGNADRVVIISVLCQRDQAALEADMDAYESELGNPYLESSRLDGCDCGDQKCCAVMLKAT